MRRCPKIEKYRACQHIFSPKTFGTRARSLIIAMQWSNKSLLKKTRNCCVTHATLQCDSNVTKRIFLISPLRQTQLQGWAGMTFGSSGTGTGMDNSIPEVREREGNWKNPFPQFGNGKGMKKNHSQNSGMGREWKNLFPKFGNGKGMKKIHSHNSGTGREWKKSIPTIREWESEAIIPKNSREREREWKNITWQ